MNKIEQRLATNIAACEPFSSPELGAAKGDLIRDADVLIGVSQRIVKEFSYLVEASIIEGLRGNIEQSVVYHKLSFQCLQINGMLMEHAREEGPMEYYLSAREKNAA